MKSLQWLINYYRKVSTVIGLNLENGQVMYNKTQTGFLQFKTKDLKSGQLALEGRPEVPGLPDDSVVEEDLEDIKENTKSEEKHEDQDVKLDQQLKALIKIGQWIKDHEYLIIVPQLILGVSIIVVVFGKSALKFAFSNLLM